MVINNNLKYQEIFLDIQMVINNNLKYQEIKI